jgi:hypothetical protein
VRGPLENGRVASAVKRRRVRRSVGVTALGGARRGQESDMENVGFDPDTATGNVANTKTPLARICQRARGGSDRTFGELGAGDPPRPPSISSLSDSMICFRTKSRRG